MLYVKEMAEKLKIKEPDLLTRPVGRRLYQAAKRKMVSLIKGETVICDFKKIEVIDPSFVDEFIVKLIDEGKKEDFYIKLTNLSKTAEQNIRSVFNSYNEFTPKKCAVVTEELTEENSHVIGSNRKEQRELIEILRINNILSKDKLGYMTGLKDERLDTMLNEMSDLRLIKKQNSSYVTV